MHLSLLHRHLPAQAPRPVSGNHHPGAVALGLFAALLCATQAHAQQSMYPPAPPPPLNSPAPAAPPSILQWVPPGMATLSHQATWHTDFTLDRSMLTLAGNLYGVDDPTRRTIARLNGVSLHLCRFPANTSYDPATLESIRAQYGAMGWKHFSTTKQEPGEPMSEANGRTDVWLDTHGINIAGAAILMAGPSSVNLIDVSGDLSTLDILRLRGHFGIPRFPEDALPH